MASLDPCDLSVILLGLDNNDIALPARTPIAITVSNGTAELYSIELYDVELNIVSHPS
jgi:hypothetical protein